MRSLSPSTAAACSKPAASRTFWVPWSGRITATTASRTSGSSPIAVRVATQSAGRLKVGMPMVTAARPRPGCVGVPAASTSVRSPVDGGEVEPVPAAVLERPQVQLHVDGVLAGPFQHHAADEDRGAVGLGAVDVDAAGAAQLQVQPHRGEGAPVAPVARGERVEVGRERHLALLRHTADVRESTRSRRPVVAMPASGTSLRGGSRAGRARWRAGCRCARRRTARGPPWVRPRGAG